MPDPGYEAVVIETFGKKPLRTVLMIDDEFPTFADLARGPDDDSAAKFKQKDLAVALYESFRRRDMICDVENDAVDVHAERFRKSDLIVLDYHLGPGNNNSERSIAILRKMAVSKHFNTVVVYTAEKDLDDVWLDVIANVSAGWTTLPAELEGDAKEHWERLSNAQTLPGASRDAMMHFAARRRLRDLPAEIRKAAQDELRGLDVPAPACGKILEAMLHIEMTRRAGEHAGQPRRLARGGFAGGVRWIQAENAFIAILNKGDADKDAADPGGIMAGLGAALQAWQPNLIQILTSEIQNILEFEALATADEHLREPVTQTALIYYLLETLGKIDPAASPDVRVPLTALIDKIIEGMRRRLSTDANLLQAAGQALLGELLATGWNDDTWPAQGSAGLLNAASTLARTDGQAPGLDTMFRLNSFLSTEKFRRAHITAGTVFFHHGANQYFVAASPACDLVSREPSVDQAWARLVFPTTPLVALLLTETEEGEALADAAKGLHLFVEMAGHRKAFKAVVGASRQPSYEFFMVKGKGLVRQHEGKTVFDAERLQPVMVANGTELKPSEVDREWVAGIFEVVGQLRNLHATRLLLLTGQHLSRVGLDFMDMPPH